MNQQSHLFDYLAGHRTISLTTYYKSGKGVATPVDFVRKNDRLYVSTRIHSYKVKRLKINSNATIAPCTMRGKLKGPKIDVTVKILPKEEEEFAIETMKEALTLFYKFLIAVSKLAFWRKKTEWVYLEVTPRT